MSFSINNVEIIPLFPVAVLRTFINHQFTKKEIEFLKNCNANVYSNEGNTTSKERYVLNNPEMTSLKLKIQSVVNYYIKNIILLKPEVQIYITQSWLNFTSKNQYHHKHAHPNSFLSGVFYIDAGSEDEITFHKTGYTQISVEPKEWNTWNSSLWWIPIKTGELLLFPSSLEHSVKIKKQKNNRCSLAFNTFLKGHIGDFETLTELTL